MSELLSIFDTEEPTAQEPTTAEIQTIVEGDKSPDYYKIVQQIKAGIAASREGGFREVKIQNSLGNWVPIGQFFAADVFRLELTKEEREELFARYLPEISARQQPEVDTRYTAPSGRPYDGRERAAGAGTPND